ncbi:MAG: M67 family metallopeptidase [Bacillota bacterium]
MDTLCIPRRVWGEVIHLCRLQLPGEACGILAGTGNRVSRAIPLPNISPTPTRAYLADPESLYRALLDIEERGEQLLAIYHSHPAGPATLSPVDLEQAFWPVVHVVISPADNEPRAAAYRLQRRNTGTAVFPVCLEFGPDPAEQRKEEGIPRGSQELRIGTGGGDGHLQPPGPA